MKYARVINDKAVDTVESDPAGLFHPTVAAEFDQVPDTVVDGSIYDSVNDTWTPPVNVTAVDSVVKFSHPISAPKATNITVNVTVENAIDNSVIDISATYYVPLMDVINKVMDQMLVIPIVNGSGSVVLNIANPGVYSIDPDMIRPKPTARISETPDISIF